MLNRKYNKRGSVAIEVLIGSVIISLALISSVLLMGKAMNITRQIMYEAKAAFLLEEGVESIKSIRDTDWDDISTLTDSQTYYISWNNGVYELSTTPSTIGEFTKTAIFESVYRDSEDDIVSSGGTIDDGTRFVTINVSWQNGTNTLSKEMSFYITNIFGN